MYIAGKTSILVTEIDRRHEQSLNGRCVTGGAYTQGYLHTGLVVKL
jgi:hypothetical protein